LAALRAAPAGGINTTWFCRARIDGGLLYLAVGEGIAQADIHGGRPPWGGNELASPTG